MNAPLPEEKVEALAEHFRRRLNGEWASEVEERHKRLDLDPMKCNDAICLRAKEDAQALAPLVAGWLAEADNEARLSEMQGKADSLTGELIVDQAKAEERERVAAAIDAERESGSNHSMTDIGLRRAARIARGTA